MTESNSHPSHVSQCIMSCLLKLVVSRPTKEFKKKVIPMTHFQVPLVAMQQAASQTPDRCLLWGVQCGTVAVH